MKCHFNPPLALTRSRIVTMSRSSAISRLAAVTTIGVIVAAAEVLRRYFRGAIRRDPPIPEERPHDVHFGKVDGKDHGDGELMNPPVVRSDPLFWLRDDDRKDPEVIRHLEQENAYTNYMTLDIKSFSNKVYKELLSHFMETDSTVPAKNGLYAYYTKTLAGKSYKYYCRKEVLTDGFGEEEVMLDVNHLAKGLKHCDIGSTSISPDDKILAYSIDTSGYETYEIRFKDLATGKLLQHDTIRGTTGNLEWGKDSQSVYFSTFDDAHRPWKLWRHDMCYDGSDCPEDVCLHTETDTEFNLYFSKSRSRRFIFLGSSASTVSESRFIDLENVDAGVQLIRAREAGVMYSVTHAKDDIFYIVTNADGATNFKLMWTTVDKPGDWEEFIPYDEKRKIDGISTFANFAVVSGRENGYAEMWMIPDHDPSKMYLIEMEEAAHVVHPSTNAEYDTDKFRFGYSSLTTPKRFYDYDVVSRKMTLLKETEVPHYNRELYKTERLEAISVDGEKIPISLVYNANAINEGPNRLHLYGYGSYEISIDPSFSMSRLPLLDRGVMYAIAHVRGGGEYGRQWYEAAKFETKIKTFQDFCACAEKLIADKRTTPQMLSMEGRSAGGLLMGAVMNMRPELFKAALAGVPFVDVLNTMSDPSIPLTTGEWQEWGNPHEKKYFDVISEYCPYSNVSAKPYPATLIQAGLYDPRVLYSEPAKWAVKLRKLTTSGEPILLKIDMSSGHFSASNRYTYLKQRSFELAWLLRQLDAPDAVVAQ